MTEDISPRRRRLRAIGGAAVILAAVTTIYFKSTSAFFFDDDFHWLVQTQAFSPWNMLNLSLYSHFYRPVIELYFAAGLSLFGCNPFPFHVASIVIHLLTTSAVYLLARALSGREVFAFVAALFFAVQPGFTDTVTWIGAITDLLPVLWYVLTIWCHLRWLQSRRQGWYLGALACFFLCHLTHESSATLLPMMLLVDYATGRGGPAARLAEVTRHWARYVPFGILLTAYLAIAWIVNSRSYLVQEGHYAFGWHAIPNILNYIIWLYVGRRAFADYALVTTVWLAVAWIGSPRMRLSAAWVVITLLPVAFFTWENATRYLYLPAVGFSMLLADLALALATPLAARLTVRWAQVVVAALVVIVAGRFAVFGRKAADSFPARTAHYERFVSELRRANPGAAAGATVYIDERFLEGVPELYREPAARIGLCLPDLRLVMR